MIISQRQDFPNTINIDGHNFERVEKFKYLGSILSSKSEIEKDIQQRIVNANRAYFGLNNLFKSRLVSQNSKIKLYMAVVRPVLLYGCETWATSQTLEERICAFERKVLRKIYGPTFNIENGRWERRQKEDLYQRFGKVDVGRYIRGRRLQWLGHVIRAGESIPNRAFNSQLIGRRPRGRPRTRWKDRVMRTLQQVEPTASLEDAMDRRKWLNICNRYLRL